MTIRILLADDHAVVRQGLENVSRTGSRPGSRGGSGKWRTGRPPGIQSSSGCRLDGPADARHGWNFSDEPFGKKSQIPKSSP